MHVKLAGIIQSGSPDSYLVACITQYIVTYGGALIQGGCVTKHSISHTAANYRAVCARCGWNTYPCTIMHCRAFTN